LGSDGLQFYLRAHDFLEKPEGLVGLLFAKKAHKTLPNVVQLALVYLAVGLDDGSGQNQEAGAKISFGGDAGSSAGSAARAHVRSIRGQ
jgi:hypothetical protein